MYLCVLVVYVCMCTCGVWYVYGVCVCAHVVCVVCIWCMWYVCVWCLCVVCIYGVCVCIVVGDQPMHACQASTLPLSTPYPVIFITFLLLKF